MSFNLRKFLTENKLTKASKAIVNENTPGFDRFMDAVDDHISMYHPRYEELQRAVEDALYSGQIDSRPYEPGSYYQQVVQIAKELGIEDSDQHDSVPEIPGFEGTRDALNNLGLKEYQHLDDLNQPNPAKGMEGQHSMEETLDDQPLDVDPTDGRGVNTSFDPSKYESVEQLMKEIEVTANRAALQEKMKRVKEAYESLEQKATALEEGEDSKYVSSAKLKEMKKNAKTLRGMYEKYEKDYNKRFNEEMKPKKKVK